MTPAALGAAALAAALETALAAPGAAGDGGGVARGDVLRAIRGLEAGGGPLPPWDLCPAPDAAPAVRLVVHAGGAAAWILVDRAGRCHVEGLPSDEPGRRGALLALSPRAAAEARDAPTAAAGSDDGALAALLEAVFRLVRDDDGGGTVH